MAQNTKQTVYASDEFTSTIWQSEELTFVRMCANLRSKPRFGYGMIEPVLDDRGRLATLHYGLPVNENQFEE